MNKYHVGDLVATKEIERCKVICGRVLAVLQVAESGKKEMVGTYMYAIDYFTTGAENISETDIIGVVKQTE